MKVNVEIAQRLGYLKIEKGALIDIKDINKYPDSKIVVLCTGAQGEGGAVLMRIANREHKFIRLHKGDAVIFSSSIIPGNERAVQDLRDVITRQGGRVFHYGMMDIHAGGHAGQEDLKMMINFMKPKFFMPIHGNHYMLRLHADLAEGLGIKPRDIVVADNGQVIELGKNTIRVTKEKAPSNYVMVDGLGIGDVGNVVLRDRQVMAKDGMFVVITIVDSKTGKVRGNPDIISRGFVYLRESKELLDDTRKKVKKIVEESASPKQALNASYIKDQIRNRVGEFLYSKTKRRPMVLPVVIEI